MNYYLQKYTTHQFTYFIYYLFQENFKNAKMMKIQQVHQKLHAKQFLLFYPLVVHSEPHYSGDGAFHL